MNSREAAYFESWVRQEQVSYWLIALLLIAITVAAFFLFQPEGFAPVESSIGTITIEESPSLNIFTYIIFAMPALWGFFILYWTSNRDHVRTLTSSVMRHQVGRWAILGIGFIVFGSLQIFGEGSVLQNIVLGPSLLAFGLFALFRSFKIWGFRALRGIE